MSEAKQTHYVKTDKFFYQLMIPTLGLMGSPQRCDHLKPDMFFIVPNMLKIKKFDDTEIAAVRPAGRFFFMHRETYPFDGGLCGLYELVDIE